MSLRLRFLLALIPLFVVGLVIADAATYASLQSFLLDRVDSQLRAAHPTIEQALLGGGEHGPGGPGGFVSVPSGTVAELRTPAGAVVPGGILIIGGVDNGNRPQLPAALNPGNEAAPTMLTVSGTGSVSRYRVFVEQAQGTSDLLVVAMPLSDVESTLNHLLVLELGISGGVTLIVLAATWFIVRRGLRPLERMGDTARTIAASGLWRRVSPATDRTEVGRLGLALNTMLGELETSFAARAASELRLRHFVSDASHELRTPLTSIRGYAELVRLQPDLSGDEATMSIRRIEEEAGRMGVLVDDLLLLARLDQGRPLERAPVDLGALVADACSDARAADPGRVITPRVAAPLVVPGDQMRLRQVLGNLVRNALVHTPGGTPVEVSLDAREGMAVIEVIDHGAGIPGDATAKIFERFHRVDPGRSRDRGGSGLGLSIAAAVVEAHSGRIDVRTTERGGATFHIELPLDDGAHRTAPPEFPPAAGDLPARGRLRRRARRPPAGPVAGPV